MTAEQDESAPPRRQRRSTQAGATIEDVAAAAGVSRQTVTRAMNDMTGISEQTKARVLAAAKGLRYRPSRFGRGLARAAHDTLGLVVSDLTNPYYPEFASAIVRYAGERGWSVVLVDTHPGGGDAAPPAGHASRVLTSLARQVDVVVGYLGPRETWEDELAGVPVVTVDPPVRGRGDGDGVVRLDPAAALADAAAHLAVTGARTAVAVDISTADWPTGRAVLVRDAFAARGISTRIDPGTGQGVAAGRDAVARLLAHGELPDVLVGWNDMVAVGALSALHEAGVDVPGRVRVLGIDGLALGAYVTPALSTLSVDMDEVARHAVELALAVVRGEGDAGGGPHRTVGHVFLPRGSA